MCKERTPKAVAGPSTFFSSQCPTKTAKTSFPPRLYVYPVILPQLSKLLSQYILIHKNDFFDYRNNKLVVCDGDPLGHAFNVRSFHRSQVM